MGGVVAKTKTPTSNDLKPGLNGVSRRRKLKPWISALALESLFSQVRACVHLRSLWVVLRWPALCLEMKSCIQCKETCPFGHPTRRPEEETLLFFSYFFFAGTLSSSSFNLSKKIAIQHAIKHRFDMYMYSLINAAHLLPSNYTSEHHRRTVGFLFLLIL